MVICVTTGQAGLLAVEETSSVFDVARGMGTPDEGSAVYTKRQRTAVGRLQPVSSGGLWFTVITYPKQSATTSPLLTLTTALSVVRGIAKTTGIQPLLRWPNEITVQGDLVAAVSVEMEVVNDVIVRALAGAGVYCTTNQSELSPNNTSLSAVYGSDIVPEKLLENILAEFYEKYEAYKAGWRIELVEEVRDVMEYFRSPVSVTLSHGTQLIGVIDDLDELGRVSLRVDQERILLAPADVEKITLF